MIKVYCDMCGCEADKTFNTKYTHARNGQNVTVKAAIYVPGWYVEHDTLMCFNCHNDYNRIVQEFLNGKEANS